MPSAERPLEEATTTSTAHLPPSQTSMLPWCTETKRVRNIGWCIMTCWLLYCRFMECGGYRGSSEGE
ncbi:hypothetical protein H9L39_14651 [Fusarium oxysporum f. sp. albedinis]|nr:hypothetical protein H9L39_14651 [Fusarium oxysporum f. sp. albedinis]